jgi:predicted enzyme related to lactoylglutathione lyase
MQGSLYYFTFPTADLARAKRFFGEALGWEFDDSGHITNIADPHGGIHQQESMIDAKLWLNVDDVEVSVARVRSLGGESTDVGESRTGWWADCKDPDGAAFSIGRMRPEFDAGDLTGTDSAPTIRYWTQPVRGLASAKSFYAGVFGWEFSQETETYAHVSNSNSACGLMIAKGNAPEIWFKALDIKDALARLQEVGGSAEEPSESPSGLSAACKDDQGMRFNLWQPAPGQG